MDEFPIGLSRGGELLRALHAVDDEARGPALAQRGADERQESGEALVPDLLVATDVVELLGDVLQPEEAQSLEVPHHLPVRLDEQGHVDAPPAAPLDVVETQLVGQDGLAAARGSHQGVGAPLLQASLEDEVEPRDAALDTRITRGMP